MIKSCLSHIKKLDWILIAAAVLLVGIGLLSLYSSSSDRGDLSNFNKQIVFFVIGFFSMFFLSFADWRTLRDNPYLILLLYSLGLLVLAGLFFFASEIRGVQGWYKVGPLTIDPIEAVKFILIILLAKYFSTRHVEMYQVRHILISAFYVSLPAALVFFQPDLGQVIILFALWVGVLIVSGISFKRFLILLFCFLLIFALIWNFALIDYQRDRILSFVQPQLTDPLAVGWSQRQARIAIGSGGVFGQGIGSGSQTQYGFLPEPQTDFIFAAIAEETGLIGVTVLLFLLAILIWRISKIALLAQTNFARIFASGFSILLISQIFINIGMNIGLLPIIGIPLPLVSYGGSNLIATFLGLGILQSIKSH
jgi:rod shape determining protein RodA